MSAQQPPPPGVKLRGSCEPCAASKVKCSREKPTCARCAKRGTECQYFATQLPGRKHRFRRNYNNSVSSNPPPPTTHSNNWETAPQVTQQTTPSPSSTGPSDYFPELVSSGASSINSFNTGDINFDEFIDSLQTPMSFSMPGTPHDGMNPLTNISPPHMHASHSASSFGHHTAASIPLARSDSLSGLMETNLDLLEHGLSSSFPSSNSSLSHDAHTPPGLRPSNSPSCCLEVAFELTKQLAIKDGQQSPYSNAAHQDIPPQAMQAILDRNRDATETIASMMQCACSQDGYLLVCVSLLISKVLSWYAATARGTTAPDHSKPTSWPNPTTISPEQTLPNVFMIDEPMKEIDSQAALRILSELHRVQALIDQLGLRMRSVKMQQQTRAVANDATFFLEEEISFPFSASVLDQLDAELRERSNTLSLDVLERLRRQLRRGPPAVFPTYR